MNRTTKSSLDVLAIATFALALVAGAAWAVIPTQPGAFSNDGARQNEAGGWSIPYDACTLDTAELGALDETACLAAGWNWDPEALTGSNCYYNRPECNARIFFGTNRSGGANIVDAALDSQTECEAALPKLEWRSGSGGASSSSTGACDDGESRNESSCESAGHQWYSPACRGLFEWDSSLVDYTDATLANYYDCSRCHNTRHYPKPKPGHDYHGGERSVAETYVMTGHKNMVRPAAPVGNADPHYLAGAPWLDKTGAEVTADASGNAIDWMTGEITVGGVPKPLFWIYDWIDDAPRSMYDGAGYSCASCHTTGYEASPADPNVKQPYLMFGDTDPGSGTTGGTWDQFGIQCSRCHGSRLYQDASGISPDNGDMRHHPNTAPNKAATDGSYPNQAYCAADGLAWAEFGSTKRCYDPAILSSGACTAALGSWDSTNGVCYFSILASGATRTNLCMDCHKNSQPTQNLVGNAHGVLDFVGHWKGNQFLNSPHARYLGDDTQVGDKTQYDTHFQFEGESYPFDNTVRNKGLAGGCTECHDVHKSSLAEANPDGGAIAECTECHAKDLAVMKHPGGKGTPLEEMGVEPMAACETCHMPSGYHFFRVNTDPAYATFPDSVFTAPPVTSAEANKADHEGYPAVWVDLDMACGQCHGGGSAYNVTTGTIAAASGVLTVADSTGFAKGQRLRIAGANAGGADLDAYVAEVAGNDVTLALVTAGTSVTDGEVILNPTRNGAGYMDKESLATLAEGIHGDAPVASFVYTLGNPDTLHVNFSAAASACGGSSANCDVFAWDFGDGSTGTGIAPTHDYAAAGTYPVTLTVTQYGVGESEKTKGVTTYPSDYPPTLSATCVLNPDTWLMTVTDTGSSDDHALTQGVVNWGDGSLLSKDLAPPFGPFTHTYANAGSYIVTYKIADSVGQVATKTCTANPSTFAIGGVVHKTDDATPVAGVTVKYFNGTSVVKTVYTDAAGNFLATGLKPGAYTLLVTKNGWSFPNPAVSVGPSDTTLDIIALADGLVIKNRGKSSSSSRPVSDNR